MSTRANAISTIRDAWKYAAEETSRPEAIPAAYTDNRGLPNDSSILSACKVAVKEGVIYDIDQLIKYEDLTVEPRVLTFTIKGQTNTVGTQVSVTPDMITSMSLNDSSLSVDEITAAHQGNGIYSFSNFRSVRASLVIDAQYTAQSITYKTHTESGTYSSINGTIIYLKDANSPECTEAKYTWVVKGDVDLNFFVVKKETDGTYTYIGMLGYSQKAANGKYCPVRADGTKAPSVNTFPESGYEFCLSLDVDDTGGGNLTEILTIYPVDLTWQEIMQKYNFVYACVDFNGKGTIMQGMTAQLNSDFDSQFSESIPLESSLTTIKSWMICRFGVDTAGRIVVYKDGNNESLVYNTNNVTVPVETTLVGVPLTMKTGSDWTVS